LAHVLLLLLLESTMIFNWGLHGNRRGATHIYGLAMLMGWLLK